jgi:hypothetical protein
VDGGSGLGVPVCHATSVWMVRLTKWLELVCSQICTVSKGFRGTSEYTVASTCSTPSLPNPR